MVKGVVFDKADMDALAATLTKHVLKPDGKLSARVDGSGAGGKLTAAWLSILVSRPDLADALAPHAADLGWLEVETVR